MLSSVSQSCSVLWFLVANVDTIVITPDGLEDGFWVNFSFSLSKEEI
jgi:hypothetical protein